MKLNRSSGILLHPTSLPGPYGIGDLGEAAYQFIDFLVDSRQTLWQVLPLGPTSYGDSPYASFSSYAGNPLLINPDQLLKLGFLEEADIAQPPDFPPDAVDYGWVIYWKKPLLEKAARAFLAQANAEQQYAYDSFCTDHADWLDDFALFMAIKETYDQQAKEADVFGAMWSNYWDRDIALREPQAIVTWQQRQMEAITIQKVLQFFFFQQWQAIRDYANERGIYIIGDIPIFVALDSADVWANRQIFQLDDNGQATVVAGVPPDYFSPTGQLWGNPLYNWQILAEDNYTWWINRIRGSLRMVDILRIDHFRGFEAYWEIPAENETAINGTWVKGPGKAFFQAVEDVLGDLPIIAEDLGLITEAVLDLRDSFNLPGMRVLQFAFNFNEAGQLDATQEFLPHNYHPHTVVYTGTHDNDTTRGWYEARSDAEKDLVRRYMGRSDHDIVWEFIRLAMASVAGYTIFPLQDVLDLSSQARMNTPSTLGGNWAWRFQPETLSEWNASRLRDMVALYNRASSPERD